MKRAPLLITAGILILIVGGYFFYEKILNKTKAGPWDMVPSDAILVYEKNNCNSCFEAFQKSAVWKIIQTASGYQKPNDSIRNKIGAILETNGGYLISAHATKKDDFDFVFYLPVVNISEISSSFKIQHYKTSTREFNSVLIQESKFNDQTFSYAVIGNILVGSFTPFLIEDVIRTFNGGEKNGFKKSIPAQSFSTIKDDAGNLYLHLRNFSDWLSLFYAGKSVPQQIGNLTTLDIKAGENNIVFNGFSIDSVSRVDYFLSAFQHQSPVTFGLKHLISNRTVAVSSYGISDGKNFKTDLERFVKNKRPHLRDTLNRFSSTFKLEINNLYNLISDEFSICSMEPSRGSEFSKILLIETSQTDLWKKTINTLSEKLSIDTVFFERYGQYEIREIPVYQFPEKLLWPMVSGFNHSFYTLIGKVILIADNIEELKNFLDDIDSDETWGKSVHQNKFLESTLLESNVSFYFNPSSAWNILSQKLQPRWRDFVRDNQPVLQSLQMSSIQFSHLNNSYYTSVTFNYKPISSSAKTNRNNGKITTNFEHGIFKIHTVKSHVNRSNEILIQDSINDLALISSEGKVLWKLSIGDKIVSDVIQIDFFNNGKLQYLFSTANTINIIDRLGNYVDPYPISIPKINIEYINAVDYDNSKKYRFLVADKSGKLWMYDKDGNSLEGWQPKNIGGSLAMAPRHHRIKGKDYIIAIRKDGYVFLMNRRGEDLKKFPLDTESVPLGNYFLEEGGSLSETYFVIISRDGFRIRFNPEGKIQSREALLKSSIHSTFSLVPEKSNKSYLILQQDDKQLTLTDESGKRLLSSNGMRVNADDVKYYNFGSGNIFIALTDRSQGLTYIYDEKGNLLTTPPLTSSAIEIRPDNSEQFKIYYVFEKTLFIQPL